MFCIIIIRENYLVKHNIILNYMYTYVYGSLNISLIFSGLFIAYLLSLIFLIQVNVLIYYDFIIYY